MKIMLTVMDDQLSPKIDGDSFTNPQELFNIS